jgi:hypothetical protein
VEDDDPNCEPALDHGATRYIDAQGPGSATLAVENPNRAGLDVHILRPEVERLFDSQTASLKDGDQRPVADAGRSLVVAFIEEPADFGIGEGFGREAATRPTMSASG